MSLTLPSAIETYLEAKRSQRLSEHTLNDYRNTFRKFTSFVGEDCRIDRINPETIIRFLASNDTVSKKTTLNYHTALSSLWTHLVKFGRAETNIVRLVDPPRPDEKQITPLHPRRSMQYVTLNRRHGERGAESGHHSGAARHGLALL